MLVDPAAGPLDVQRSRSGNPELPIDGLQAGLRNCHLDRV